MAQKKKCKLTYDSGGTLSGKIRKMIHEGTMNKKLPGGGTIEQLLPTVAGMINPALGIGLGAAMNLQAQMQQPNTVIETDIPSQNDNPFGTTINAKGGNLVKGFKQYNARSHQNGGQMVDDNGNPSASGNNEIQNDENLFNDYVYSDTLSNPETGRKFNVDMKKIVNKHKDADKDFISKATLTMKAARLSKLNDMQRIKEQVDTSPYGGTGSKSSSADKYYEKQFGGEIYPDIPRAVDPFSGMNINLPTVPDPFAGMVEAAQPTNLEPLATRVNPVQSFLVSDNPLDKRMSQPSDAPFTGDVTDGVPGIQDRNFNYNIPAIALKAAGFAGTLSQALRKLEVETPILPNYQPADTAFDRATIDYTQAGQEALGVSNQLSQINRGASSSFNQYRTREAGRIAQLADQTARISEQERLGRSQLDVTRGQFEAQKAQDVAERLYRTRADNLQNQAVADLADERLFSELTQIGSEFNKYQTFLDELENKKQLANMTTNELISYANSLGYNFTIPEAESLIASIKAGESPIIFRKQ